MNAKSIEEAPLPKVSWAQGRRVLFDRDYIHSYLEDDYVANSKSFDPFIVKLIEEIGITMILMLTFVK